jgi:oligopeptide/dipeptide ABC transporter ATP-binding protein
MIAIALAGAPRLLIADEPTTALDVTIQAQVLDLLDDLRHTQDMALLLITHDLGVVARMADRIGVMYAGQLVEEAPRKQFFAQPAHPYSVRLFAALPDAERRGGRLATIPGSVPAAEVRHVGCRFADRCGEVMAECRTSPPPWREIESGQRVRCILPGAAPAVAAKVGAGDTAIAGDSRPLLEVSDLQVHFPIRRGILQRAVGAVRAVDGMSLQLMPGRTLALVGESGCGKTTAGKAMLQLLRPTAGSVQLDGVELTTRSASELRPLRAKMQMVFQDPFASLNPRLRIGEIIAEGMLALGTGGMGGSTGDRDIAARVGPLLEQVGLRADMAGRYPHEFSGGQRQRIAIARALAVQPRTADLRRADLGAGCVGAGADPQPACPTCRRDLGWPTCSSPTTSRWWITWPRRGGDVSRAHRRAGQCRRGAAFAAPSLHAGAARRCRAAAGWRHSARRSEAGRRHAVAGQSAGRLPFPSALPAGRRGLPPRLSRRAPLRRDAARALHQGLRGFSAFSAWAPPCVCRPLPPRPCRPCAASPLSAGWPASAAAGRRGRRGRSHPCPAPAAHSRA